MSFRKLYHALRELWWVIRQRLWMKWIRLTDPALREVTLTITPENIVLRSWESEHVIDAIHPEGNRTASRHSFWRGTAYFNFLEGETRFTISAGDGKPSAEQIGFLRELLAKKESLWRVFEIEIFKHYREYVYRQIDFFDSKGEIINDQVAPPIDTPSGMRRLLDTPSIMLDDDSPENKRFDLCFPCTWQPVGMGVDVTVRDWQVVRVG